MQHAPFQDERAEIARNAHRLRKERRWTQIELAHRLGISQARLSKIESGNGSFTAEEFVHLLKLFNVGVGHFVTGHADVDGAIQNALARLGASHLVERDDVLPTERLEEVRAAVREALLVGTPRLLTGLAPVLVRNVDQLSLPKLQLEIAEAGLSRRLAWVLENTLHALRRELGTPLNRRWSGIYRRADLLLGDVVAGLRDGHRGRKGRAVDVLDATIRSRQTLDEVLKSSSAISRRWSVATTLTPGDFADALRAAREVD